MKDTLFLHFISKSRHTNFYDLGFGYSDVYDLCKSHGDFYPVRHNGLEWASVPRMWYNNPEFEKFEIDLPISKGTVYVSAIYIVHIYQAFIWAKRYPDIKFIVGGPSASKDLWVMTSEIPSNMILTTQSVEEYFGVENFSGEWKIDVPDYLKNEEVVLPYTIDSQCYWGKCTYCTYAFCKQRLRPKEKLLNFGFEDFPHNGLKIVRLNSPSMSPKLIEYVVPKLPQRDNIRYDMYIRAAKAEVDSISKIIEGSKNHSMKFITGIEFPSSKILTSINKGITLESIFEMMDLFSDSKHELVFFIILFFDGLTKQSVKDAEEFVKRIPAGSNISIYMTRIFVKPYTEMFDDNQEREVEINLGPFYLGYIPKLSREQIELSKEVRELIRAYPNHRDFTKGIIGYENPDQL